MKTKNIIKYLKRFNKWRRWAEIEMPDPKFSWEVIDFAIDRLEKLQDKLVCSSQFITKLKEQIKNNDEYFKSAIWEIQFNSLQKQHYLSLLDEVEVLLEKNIKPSLIKKVIDNWKTRWALDVNIHFNELNPDFKWFNSSK